MQLFLSLLAYFPLLLPFLYISSVFNPYEAPKFYAFIISMIPLSIWYWYVSRKKLPSVSLFGWVVLLFLGILLVADIFGLDPRTSLLGNTYRMQGFVLWFFSVVLFFLVYLLPTEHKEKLYKMTSSIATVTGFVLCAITLVQAFLLFVLHDSTIPHYQGRIVATLGNPNFLGGYLTMLLPFIILSIWKKNIWIKLFVTVMFGLSVFLTDSRSAVLATLVTMGIFGIQSLSKRKQVAIYGILGFISIMSLYVFSNSRANHRFSMWDNREIIWTEGIKAMSASPILGYGQDNYELIFPKDRFMKVDNAHNIFLEIGVGSGIVGLVIFGVILYLGFMRSELAVRLVLIAFIINASTNPVSVVQIILLWFLLGFLRH